MYTKNVLNQAQIEHLYREADPRSDREREIAKCKASIKNLVQLLAATESAKMEDRLWTKIELQSDKLIELHNSTGPETWT